MTSLSVLEAGSFEISFRLNFLLNINTAYKKLHVTNSEGIKPGGENNGISFTLEYTQKFKVNVQ
jgi:hypothetical protein